MDADTSPCGLEDATPGSRACVRVLTFFGRVGRAGLPGAFWCASPFSLAALAFCFAWPPPGWGCPRPGPLLLFWFFLSVSPLFFFFFFPCAPFVSCFLWFPAPGALGLGALCCLFCWPRASWLSLTLCHLAIGRSLVVVPPPSLSRCCCRSALPCACLFFFFVFFSSSLRPPCVCLSVFSGPGCPGPWRWFVFVVLGSSSPVFFSSPPLGSSCALACFVSPGWPVVFPRWLLSSPPPPLLCLGVFVVPARCLGFFFLSFRAPPLSPAFSGFRPRVPWALALCFVCFSRPPPAWLSMRFRLVCVSRLAVGCSLVVAAPPCPPLLCLAFFVAPAGCLGVFFFFFFFLRAPLLSPAFFGFGPRVPWASVLCVVCFVGLPLLGSPCAFPSFVLSAWPSAAPCWLLPPAPPCVSRFSSLPLAAVCRVLCCAVCPWVRCCAVLLRVVSPGVALSCAVLCCCARLVPLLDAPCPLALPVAWGPVLCGAVFCGAPPRCVLCALFVLSWRGGACFCSPLCFVLCVSRGAVLCVLCPLRSVRCCASLRWCSRVVLFVWCVLLLAPGAVVRCCVLCCFLWCALMQCWVWWPMVVCWWRVSVLVSLSARVVCFPVVGVVCSDALLSCVVFCGAVLSRGAVLLCSAVLLRCCWGLLCPPVACRAVLCCAVGWLCCFLPGGGVCVLWCSFPRAVRSLLSPLCALPCLVVLAVVPCFPVSCAVALCCRVVLCCRALLSFCGAVSVCFALLRPVVRRRAVLCCAVACLCCFLPGGGVCVLCCPFPPCRQAQKNINHLTCHPALVAVSWLACLGGCGVLDLTPRTFHLQQKGGESVEGGARAGGEGTW